MKGTTERPAGADLPAPGWYADPSGTPRWRWWDGAEWTSWVSGMSGASESGSPPASWAPPFPVRAQGWRTRDPASLSIAVSIGTLILMDAFAPLTSPIAIVLADLARRRSVPGSAERSRSNIALALGLATFGIWFLMLPMFNAIEM